VWQQWQWNYALSFNVHDVFLATKIDINYKSKNNEKIKNLEITMVFGMTTHPPYQPFVIKSRFNFQW
jgi:hypothetical protein